MVSEERIKEAAELFEVPEHVVRQGVELTRRGIPELIKAVRDGRIDMRHAVAISQLTKPKQQHAVSEALCHYVPAQTKFDLK